MVSHHRGQAAASEPSSHEPAQRGPENVDADQQSQSMEEVILT